MNIQRIKEIFQEYTDEENFSGVALIKKGNEEVFSYNYGHAHRGFGVGNKISTKFDTASMTKLFTAVGTFQLIEKGKIRLEDKVLDIINIEDTTISKDITIYQLLTHTSGIGDDADEEAGENYADIWKDKPNYSVRELEDFLPQFIHKEANFEPGKGCRYNNCAYILLGLVIEKITGKSYFDYIRDNIFDKIGMENTFFYSMDEINENVAEGYEVIEDENEEIIGWKKNIYSYPPKGAADAGAYTTVTDMDIFVRALVSNELLSKEMTDEILKPQELHAEGEKRSKYMGYGFEFIIRNRDNGIVCIYKDGSNAGVACETEYYPEIDTTLTILANTDACDIWELAFEVREEMGLVFE